MWSPLVNGGYSLFTALPFCNVGCPDPLISRLVDILPVFEFDFGPKLSVLLAVIMAAYDTFGAVQTGRLCFDDFHRYRMWR